MITLANLKPAKGSMKNRKRVGRGPGSGHGKTACRGMNGQRSRSGYKKNRGFEGGQMPLFRRIPKRGFTNIFKQEYNIINIDAIEKCGLPELKIEDFYTHKLAQNKSAQIKILGNGQLTKKVKVEAHKFSKAAKDKITSAGGDAVVFKGDKN